MGKSLVLVERFPDPLSQLGRGKRLLDKADAVLRALCRQVQRGVSRHIKDFDRWMRLLHSHGDLTSGDPRQPDVSQEQVDIPRMISQNFFQSG